MHTVKESLTDLATVTRKGEGAYYTSGRIFLTSDQARMDIASRLACFGRQQQEFLIQIIDRLGDGGTEALRVHRSAVWNICLEFIEQLSDLAEVSLVQEGDSQFRTSEVRYPLRA